jgi:two-component system KDP operon response regulator KdpE
MMSPAQCRVLVAIDEPAIREKLLSSLGSMGVSLDTGTPEHALEVATLFSAGVVVLSSSDVGWSGVCRQLRTFKPDLGIVIALAGSDPAGEAAAFEAGADDVIAPPYRFRELVGRIRAAAQHPVASATQSVMLHVGDLELDARERRVRREKKEISLSPQLFELLLLLMRNPEVTLNRIRLLEAVRGRASTRDAGHLRSYIKALRHKIERDPARPEYILTEPWVGYRFHDPVHNPADSR